MHRSRHVLIVLAVFALTTLLAAAMARSDEVAAREQAPEAVRQST